MTTTTTADDPVFIPDGVPVYKTRDDLKLAMRPSKAETAQKAEAQEYSKGYAFFPESHISFCIVIDSKWKVYASWPQ